MTINSSFGVQGWCKFDAVHKVTGKVRPLAGWQKNLITNQGLDALATEADVMLWFHVGTSDTEPSVTDTWVGALVASTNTITTNVNGTSGSTPHYGYKRKTARFDYGDAEGNLSEAAVGWSDTTGTAFSHMLIRDGAGDPISITVQPTEYLDFSYELRHIAPTIDVTGTVDISGTSYNFTTRALNVTSTIYWSDDIGNRFREYDDSEVKHRAYAGNIGLITASVPGGDDGGVGSGTTDVVASSYLAGDYYLYFTVSASPTQWNVAGGIIRSLVLSCHGNRWQTEFAKVSDGTGISKTTGNSASMGWRVNWMRA